MVDHFPGFLFEFSCLRGSWIASCHEVLYPIFLSRQIMSLRHIPLQTNSEMKESFRDVFILLFAQVSAERGFSPYSCFEMKVVVILLLRVYRSYQFVEKDRQEKCIIYQILRDCLEEQQHKRNILDSKLYDPTAGTAVVYSGF